MEFLPSGFSQDWNGGRVDGVVLRFIDRDDEFATKVIPMPPEFYRMTTSDIVHKVFAEILSWEQHEACERFRFRGVAIFDPHSDVDILRIALGGSREKEATN